VAIRIIKFSWHPGPESKINRFVGPYAILKTFLCTVGAYNTAKIDVKPLIRLMIVLEPHTALVAIIFLFLLVGLLACLLIDLRVFYSQ